MPKVGDRFYVVEGMKYFDTDYSTLAITKIDNYIIHYEYSERRGSSNDMYRGLGWHSLVSAIIWEEVSAQLIPLTELTEALL
jgi:hypothetical protein